MQACIGMHNQNEPEEDTDARKYSTNGCFRRILLIQQQDNLQGSRKVMQTITPRSKRSSEVTQRNIMQRWDTSELTYKMPNQKFIQDLGLVSSINVFFFIVLLLLATFPMTIGVYVDKSLSDPGISHNLLKTDF